MYAVEILSLFTLCYYPNSTQVQFDERPISKESRRYICTYMYVCMYVCTCILFLLLFIVIIPVTVVDLFLNQRILQHWYVRT